MKRTELIQKLLKEGFSEKTLVNFSDSQLKQLASRILSEEEDVMISKKDPQFQQKIAAAKKTNKTIETYEELKGNQSKIDKNHNGKIDADDFAILNKEKKGEVKEGLFGGKHKKVDTIKHDGYEMDVFSKGKDKVYGHPRKEGSKNQNDKERLVYSDLEGLKKSVGSMGKGEKNVIFPKSKKISNPDYKSTTVDINEVDMGLTVKSAPKSTPLFGGAPKKSSSPKKKSTPKKKEVDETEEGEMDESLHGIMIGATKEKLKKDLGRDPEDHEVEKELGKFVNSWKKDNESKEKKGKNPYNPGKPPSPDFNGYNKRKEKKKEDVDEMLRFYDDDGNPIKNKKGEQDAVSTKDKNFKKKVKSKKCPECQKDTKDCECDHTHLDENKTIKNWVKGLVENKEFHSFTSKNEIMELIQTKLNESETMVQHGPKVKKGHNGIPEFMSYDAIVSAEPKTAPSKPAPSTKPGTKPTPTRREDPRKTPFQPGPGPNPKPKAKIAEEKKKK
jgi:Ca2+-binding EF-hand superfamily protein